MKAPPPGIRLARLTPALSCDCCGTVGRLVALLITGNACGRVCVCPCLLDAISAARVLH